MPDAQRSHHRLAGSLVLSLALPGALALSLFARPYLGLPALPQTNERDQLTNGAADESDLGQNIPATPAAEVDAIRIECAQKEYKALSDYRHRFQTSLRFAVTPSDRLASEITLAQHEDDYRCSYQQVTPEGCQRAHLPAPTDLGL